MVNLLQGTVKARVPTHFLTVQPTLASGRKVAIMASVIVFGKMERATRGNGRKVKLMDMASKSGVMVQYATKECGIKMFLLDKNQHDF